MQCVTLCFQSLFSFGILTHSGLVSFIVESALRERKKHKEVTGAETPCEEKCEKKPFSKAEQVLFPMLI
jgi:hypothetical protein